MLSTRISLNGRTAYVRQIEKQAHADVTAGFFPWWISGAGKFRRARLVRRRNGSADATFLRQRCLRRISAFRVQGRFSFFEQLDRRSSFERKQMGDQRLRYRRCGNERRKERRAFVRKDED